MAEPRQTPSPMLQREGAVADGSQVAWHYGDPVGEQRAMARGEAVVDCSALGVVAVTGPDRLSWLHSLTTQRLDGLAPYRSTETLVLSPQGHVEHAAGVVDDGETTWLLARSAAALASWLDSMRFMLRVEVADVSDRWAVIGETRQEEGGPGTLVWSDPWPTTAPGGTRYGPPDEEHPGAAWKWRLAVVPREGLVAAIEAREADGMRLAGTWAVEAERIAAWRPSSADVDPRTLPHELDWLRTAVHLSKGCYRGQETVAKVVNVGRPPRRLVMLHLDGSGHVLPAAGASVSDSDGTVVGRVTSVARHQELGPIALAMVRRSTPEDAALVVDEDSGPVAASQVVIVGAEGVSIDRPAPRGPVAGGLLSGPRGSFSGGLRPTLRPRP